MYKILYIFGTRPEAIKLAPVIKEFYKYPDEFQTKICVTAQHREMLDQFLAFFEIKPDYDLNLIHPNQSLFDITVKGLTGIKKVVEDYKPDNIFIQGDTTTAFVSALAGFYNKIKISHIEAGLRSKNKYKPFPEEVNRVLISHLADYHFTPTKLATENLFHEGITDNVWTVGNSVIDTLCLVKELIKKRDEDKYQKFFYFLNFKKRIILVTIHRRESFGNTFKNICFALKEISQRFKDCQIVYPVHFNPNVKLPAQDILGGIDNIFLIKPLGYDFFIWLMEKSNVVLTDSGGIQEEASFLSKPVFVLRDVTERVEGIQLGIAKLIGTKKDNIVKEISLFLMNKTKFKKFIGPVIIYGDGRTSERIVKIMEKIIKLKDHRERYL
jgi:UDP-N-acetylglucosamine 2-epimerase (non-hydrolysing)